MRSDIVPHLLKEVPGQPTAEELEDYAAAVGHPLTADELTRIEELRAVNFHHVDAYQPA